MIKFIKLVFPDPLVPFNAILSPDLILKFRFWCHKFLPLIFKLTSFASASVLPICKLDSSKPNFIWSISGKLVLRSWRVILIPDIFSSCTVFSFPLLPSALFFNPPINILGIPAFSCFFFPLALSLFCLSKASFSFSRALRSSFSLDLTSWSNAFMACSFCSAKNS